MVSEDGKPQRGLRSAPPRPANRPLEAIGTPSDSYGRLSQEVLLLDSFDREDEVNLVTNCRKKSLYIEVASLEGGSSFPARYESHLWDLGRYQ